MARAKAIPAGLSWLVMLLFIAPQSTATGPDELVPIIEGAADRGGWDSYWFSTSSSTIWLEIVGQELQAPAFATVALYDASGELKTGLWVIATGGGVEIGKTDGLPEPICDPPVPGGAEPCYWTGTDFLVMQLRFSDLDPGTYGALLAWIGPGSWRHAVLAEEGNALARASGHSGKIFQAADFPDEAGVDVEASADLPGAPPTLGPSRARTAVHTHLFENAKVSFHIDDVFVGTVFYDRTLLHPESAQFQATLVTPTGNLTCPCTKLRLIGPLALGPGDYTVNLDGLAAEDVYVAAVSAHLPS